MRKQAKALAIAVLLGTSVFVAFPQVENVPISNQIYDYLDHLGVRGILPLYSNSALPLGRSEVAAMLSEARRKDLLLTAVEKELLVKFEQEFSWELRGSVEEHYAMIGNHHEGLLAGAGSQRQKHLYQYADTSATMFVDFIGSAEYRSIHGDTRGTTDLLLGTIGGRFRGTIDGRLGYYLQSTNGQLKGDRAFALSDPRLASNFKFKDLNSPNFDQTEAYVKYDHDWLQLEFGREFTTVGLGYSGKLLLSDVAPAFDFFRVDARYKTFHMIFLHGSISGDPNTLPCLSIEAPPNSNKYLALHRFQFSVADAMNFGVSEMIIYQRFTPEYAYLVPVNFFKSSEHQLHDRDNAFLAFDAELFAWPGWKFYGTWLIDDINFPKMGTGWWGNEFGWQGGAYWSRAAGFDNVDALLEYTRIEPYVYSNRVAGNDYAHNSIGLGHRLEPNSDELLCEIRFRPSSQWRFRLQAAYERHGNNIMLGDSLLRNVGGNVLQGHRGNDSETARFLDGDLVKTIRLQGRVDYEPITGIFLAAAGEFTSAADAVSGTRRDFLAMMQLRVEY
jgi:hypothetical protein